MLYIICFFFCFVCGIRNMRETATTENTKKKRNETDHNLCSQSCLTDVIYNIQPFAQPKTTKKTNFNFALIVFYWILSMLLNREKKSII